METGDDNSVLQALAVGKIEKVATKIENNVKEWNNFLLLLKIFFNTYSFCNNLFNFITEKLGGRGGILMKYKKLGLYLMNM